MNRLLELWNTVWPLIVVLTVIVFVHEMGHFLIARHNGVQVKSFSIGFGPELFGWTDRQGTRWKVSALPFGGYVMMLGDEDATSTRADLSNVKAEDHSKTLTSKTPLQRMMVAFGGPLFNLIFTFLVVLVVGLFRGVPTPVPQVQSVMAESVAEQAGLREGDVIVKIGGEAVTSFEIMVQVLERFAGQDVALEFTRAGETQTVTIPLYTLDSAGQKVPVNRLGIAMATELKPAGLGETLLYPLTYCWSMTKGYTQMLGKMFSGKKEAKLGSIFAIGSSAKSVAHQGVWQFVSFMAALSFSLGFFNLLPIPGLDGGNMFLSLCELIRGRPLSETFVTWAYWIGMSCVAALMLWALWNDFVQFKFIQKIVEGAKTVWHWVF